MTAEMVDYLSRYANKIYYQDTENFFCKDGDFEDFKQSFLLCALEHEGDTPAMILSRLKYSKMCQPEAIQYRLTEMCLFSDLIPEGDEYDFERIEQICGTFEEFDPFIESDGVIEFIANYLYPTNEKGREQFLDHMYGVSISGGKNRDIREMVFRHRFEILKILYKSGYLTVYRYKHFLRLASEAVAPAKAVKHLKDTSERRAQRDYYQRNKEYFAEKAKRYNEKKRQERQKAD